MTSTADRILAAALAGFAHRGVEATSLDSLAAELGIRKQTILYWFASKEILLMAVIDHAVADLGDRLTDAVLRAKPTTTARVEAVVGATFRLGTTDPELLAVVREVSRLGAPATTHLADALEPLLDRAVASLGTTGVHHVEARRVLIDAGARVVGMATEAEVRTDLGHPPDLAWLRARRRVLVGDVLAALTGDGPREQGLRDRTVGLHGPATLLR